MDEHICFQRHINANVGWYHFIVINEADLYAIIKSAVKFVKGFCFS